VKLVNEAAISKAIYIYVFFLVAVPVKIVRIMEFWWLHQSFLLVYLWP